MRKEPSWVSWSAETRARRLVFRSQSSRRGHRERLVFDSGEYRFRQKIGFEYESVAVEGGRVVAADQTLQAPAAPRRYCHRRGDLGDMQAGAVQRRAAEDWVVAERLRRR